MEDKRPGMFQKGGIPGPGRPVGKNTIASKEAVKRLNELGVNPLDYLASVMNDDSLSEKDRMRAADRLIEYAYSKQPTMIENKIEGAMPVMNVKVKPKEE